MMVNTIKSIALISCVTNYDTMATLHRRIICFSIPVSSRVMIIVPGPKEFQAVQL